MKTSKMTRWMIAAAALAAAAGSAAAQTYRAEIPLSFHMGDKLMPPGAYQVEQVRRDGTQIVFIRNLDTHETVATVAGVPVDPPKAWVNKGDPMLGFQCVSGNCALTRLWDGRDQFAYHFRAHKLPPGEETMTAIMLKPVKAD